MTDPVRPANSTRSDAEMRDESPLPRRRPARFATDIVPVGPNLLATFASFIVLMIAPWLCLNTLEHLWEDSIVNDRLGTYFLVLSWEDSFANALSGAVLFLVIGAILQAWRHHRPFLVQWPIVLAFPIAFGLVLPEALRPGGSIVSAVVVGVILATAFGVHWGLVAAASDAME